MRGAILPAKSFSRWVKRINALKRSLTDSDYLRATQLGFEELRKNGITTVLNIVSTPQIFPLLPPPPIRAWFFLELIDVRPRPWIEEHAFGSWLFFAGNGDRLGGLGLSPHAPYTASAKMYEVALECSRSLNMLITTHVAESSEEYAMFAESSGELHDFLKELGRPMTDCGSTSPLRHLIENRLIDPDCIVAHLNELDDRDLEILSRTEWRNLQIVHCPKSHRFLHQKRFPLEALTERGLNISLGTDSLASNDSLNLFSEMRTAKKMYQTLSAREVLEMVTIRPARALKLERELGRIAPGYLADSIAIPFKGAAGDVLEAIIAKQRNDQMDDGKWTSFEVRRPVAIFICLFLLVAPTTGAPLKERERHRRTQRQIRNLWSSPKAPPSSIPLPANFSSSKTKTPSNIQPVRQKS